MCRLPHLPRGPPPGWHLVPPLLVLVILAADQGASGQTQPPAAPWVATPPPRVAPAPSPQSLSLPDLQISIAPTPPWNEWWWWTPPPPPAPAPDPDRGNPAPKTYYQAHGWLMVVAYVVLMPVAVMAARFAQAVTLHWYSVHWVLQVLAILCIIPGCTVAGMYFDAMDHVHGQLGVALVALTLIQPLIAAVRPPRGVRGRLAWFVAHWLIGISVLLLSWYNCFGGLRLYQALWGTQTSVLQVALMAYLGFLGFIFLFLSRWEHIRDQEKPDQLAGAAPSQSSWAQKAQDGIRPKDNPYRRQPAAGV